MTAMGELYRWKESRDVPDTLNAILEYPEGFTVNLSSTFNNQSSSEASFTFLGTEGTLSVGWLGDHLGLDMTLIISAVFSLLALPCVLMMLGRWHWKSA